MITIGLSGVSGTGPEGAADPRPRVAVLGTGMMGGEESLALADTIGVDHQALRDALKGSPVNAPVALLKLAKIDTGDESPDFSLRWATKDVDLALAEAGDQTLPVAAAIDHRWHALVEAGLGQADVSAVRQGLGEAAVKS